MLDLDERIAYHIKKIDGLGKKLAEYNRGIRDAIRKNLDIAFIEEREKLKALRREVADLEEKETGLKHCIQWLQKMSQDNLGYPNIPPAQYEPMEKGEGMPNSSGVYFVWDNSSLAYVGQSIKLKNRVTTGHPKIKRSDRLSYLEFNEDELLFAESYYIGVGQPWRNGNSLRSRNNLS